MQDNACIYPPGRSLLLCLQFACRKLTFSWGIINVSVACRCLLCQGESWGSTGPHPPEMGLVLDPRQAQTLPPPSGVHVPLPYVATLISLPHICRSIAGQVRFKQALITESQHGRGWKGPLWITQPNLLTK